jgi:hypothetical protein
VGYGARLVSGCNIGAHFSGIVSGSLRRRLWLAAAFAGNVLGTYPRPLFGLEIERVRQTGCQNLHKSLQMCPPAFTLCNWGRIVSLHLRSVPRSLSLHSIYYRLLVLLSFSFLIQKNNLPPVSRARPIAQTIPPDARCTRTFAD